MLDDEPAKLLCVAVRVLPMTDEVNKGAAGTEHSAFPDSGVDDFGSSTDPSDEEIELAKSGIALSTDPVLTGRAASEALISAQDSVLE